jgi:hypothetical protein
MEAVPKVARHLQQHVTFAQGRKANDALDSGIRAIRLII